MKRQYVNPVEQQTALVAIYGLFLTLETLAYTTCATGWEAHAGRSFWKVMQISMPLPHLNPHPSRAVRTCNFSANLSFVRIVLVWRMKLKGG